MTKEENQKTSNTTNRSGFLVALGHRQKFYSTIISLIAISFLTSSCSKAWHEQNNRQAEREERIQKTVTQELIKNAEVQVLRYKKNAVRIAQLQLEGERDNAKEIAELEEEQIVLKKVVRKYFYTISPSELPPEVYNLWSK
jgi:hypothetical protein